MQWIVERPRTEAEDDDDYAEHSADPAVRCESAGNVAVLFDEVVGMCECQKLCYGAHDKDKAD